MAEIVNFPERSSCSNGAQAACSPSAERRGQELHAALNSKETFSLDDQERVPANLHALIETLCAQNGISKRAIVEASGMGGGGPEDSTKRLYEYTLPPNASETRKSKLAKKPIKYFRIAQAIAQLSGRTEHEVLCQIFEGCSYGSGSSFGVGENWNAIRWGKLTTMIQLMSGSVMARAKTDSYWQTALMVTGAHDPASGELQHSTEPLDSLGTSGRQSNREF